MGFRFAAASSCAPNLYHAIAEVVISCRAGLDGRLPDFCQLLLTTAHARNVAHAPKCLLEKLVSLGGMPAGRSPAVIGGVVKSVSGPGGSMTSGSCVSLLAASLPGVEVMPFHTDTPALPHLPGNQWARLLQHAAAVQAQQQPHDHQQQQQQRGAAAGSSGSAGGHAPAEAQHHTASILLSTPHFAGADELLRRLHGVLPGMPVLGGVTGADAWSDTEHSFGALFCNDRVQSQGAVGALLHGPLAVRQLLVRGCVRVEGAPVGAVTEAAGNKVATVDGLHASAWMEAALALQQQPAQTDDAPARRMLLGIADPRDPHAFVAKSYTHVRNPYGLPPVLAVGLTHEVPVGSRVQPLLADPVGCRQQQRQQLAALVRALPGAAATTPLWSCALLSYHSEELPGDEAQLVRSMWPDDDQVPYAGARVQGVFSGPERCGDAAAAQLQSYAASFGVLSHGAEAAY